ncbi:MAG: hypothetical protein Q9160_000629 [Pyrenula sp. 1 TL-2023]
MGQGYSLTTLSAGSANLDVPDLSDLSAEKSLGTARFMKSIRAKHHQGFAFVKAVVKPYASLKLVDYVKAIRRERDALSDAPNLLPYQRIIETATGGYLVRQYVHSSLYDRLSTRPFLEDIEKKWLAFQLLSALKECHSRQVYHGDIKTENVLVTSWNWLYLTDFSSSFKPLHLPEDNPADFSFYFDTSGRRTCYIAPERFLASDENAGKQTSHVDEGDEMKMREYMDVFSAGCVIAELFIEGAPFTLSQLFKYRRGDYSLEHTQLSKIDDPDVRELIMHMVQVDPNDRYTAQQYLDLWRRRTFPEYFYSFLHQYMSLMTDPSLGRSQVNLETANHGEPDDKIDRIYQDFDKVAYFLGLSGKGKSMPVDKARRLTGPIIPIQIRLPNSQALGLTAQQRADDGTLIFLTLVSSSLRNTSKASARVKACDLMLTLAERLPDETKLDRVLPYMVSLLTDRSDAVKVAALRSLTQLIAMIEVVSPVNAYIFPEYIFPKFKFFVLTPTSNPSPMVRAAYASCLASLAHSSSRILDLIQALRADGRLPNVTDDDWTPGPTYHGLFDVARADLVAHFEEHTKALLTDPDVSVRRAFLGSVSALCIFFGSSKASDVILTHLNTYLNDSDWILRCSFFETLVGVAIYVGSTTLENFVLPLMIQSLTDPEDFVVERVLRSLASMAELGLFEKATTWRLANITVRFAIHPSIWIREAAVHFLAAVTRFASAADKYCILMPTIQPMLKIPITDFSESQLLDCLKKPLLKSVLDMAITWASKTEKGLFWKTATQDKVFNLEESEDSSRFYQSSRRSLMRIAPSQMNDEDEQWLNKLRGLGMSNEDDMKFLALKEYAWRLAHRAAREQKPTSSTDFSQVVSLVGIGVTPQTVFFDKMPTLRSRPRRPSSGLDGQNVASEKPHTITDALLDASTTIDDATARRKKSHAKRLGHNGISRSIPRQINTGGLEGGQDSSTGPSPLGSSPGTATVSQNSSVPQTGTPKESSDPNVPGILVQESLKSRKMSDLTIRHRSSAINLMNKKDSAKADAATGTDSTAAFGKVDGPLQPHRPSEPSPLSLASGISNREKSPLRNAHKPVPVKSEVYHSYNGDDPKILGLLDNVFSENFPTDLLEFGPVIQPLSPRHKIRKASESPATGQAPDEPENQWRPEGSLVAMFSEHSAAINRVCVAPDHAFFLTASDDGAVKIWDTLRLEKNMTPRSRQTHKHAAGAKVKAMCFIDNTHTFISGATDGSLHAVKVDYQNLNGESTRYGKPQIIRQYYLPQETSSNGDDMQSLATEYALQLFHYRTETSTSLLLILTNKSNIHCLDLKNMKIQFTLSNPLHHGSCTAFVVDKKQNWLLVGTSHGILDLWDLRFRLRVRSWGLPGGQPITALDVHPKSGRGKWVIVAGGMSNGDVTVWDIEKCLCREVYRYAQPSPPSTAKPAPSHVAQAKIYQPWFPDESSQSLLDRFASSSSLDPAAPAADIDPFRAPLSRSNSPDKNLTAPKTTSLSVFPSSPPFLLTGSTDRRVRLWDLTHPEFSTTVSGLPSVPPSSSTADAPSPPSTYPTIWPDGQLKIVSETFPPASDTSTPPPGSRTGDDSSASASAATESKPRNVAMKEEQRALLKGHMDGVTGVAWLGRPYGMVVSVDRAGVVMVFQ